MIPTFHRRNGIAPAVAALALCFAFPPIVAQAEPAPPNLEDSQCEYTLTRPAIDTFPGGSQVVSATMAMAVCSGIAQSVRTTVCVERVGDTGTCSTAQGYQTSKAFAVGVPRGEFTTSGQGCYRLRSDLNLVCVSTGPLTASIQ